MSSTPLTSRLFVLITGWLLLATLARGLCDIHEWAISMWFVSYDIGFIKRGLPGTILAQVNSVLGDAGLLPDLISIVAVINLILLALALLAITSRSHQKCGQLWLLMLLAAIVSSPAITMMANLIGYYDHIITLLTITAITLVVRQHFGAAGLVAAMAVFVHETALTNMLPVLVFSLALTAWQHGWSRRQTAAQLSLLIIPTLSAFVWTFLQQGDTQQQTQRIDQLVQLFTANMPINIERASYYAQMLTYPFMDYLHEQAPKFIERITDPVYTTSVLPILAAGLTGMVMALRRQKCHLIVVIMAILVVVAPLSLHLIAFDTERIWVMPIVLLLLVGWVMAEHNLLVGAHNMPLLTTVCLLLVVYHCSLRPFGMMPADIQLWPSDLFQIYLLPILGLVWLQRPTATPPAP